MVSDDRWELLVAKLIKLTRENKLAWEGPEASVSNISGRKIRRFFARYQDKYFRVQQNSGPFLIKSKSGTASKRSGDDSYYVSILDENKSPIFTVPEGTSGFDELFQTISFQRSGVAKLIDDLLNDES